MRRGKVRLDGSKANKSYLVTFDKEGKLTNERCATKPSGPAQARDRHQANKAARRSRKRNR